MRAASIPAGDRRARSASDRNRSRIRRRLLAWYVQHRRDLPWRRTRSPYEIWVSEVMLQQTRVATALPYYRRFLDRFPDIASLAAAGEDEVLGLWAGLGYYGRARALRRGAIAVMERHGGDLPGDHDALRELPGIGPYTAGAIASIVFGEPRPAVDGNARRVLSRLEAIGARSGGGRSRERRVWDAAARLVRGPRPGDCNQALMELGARVCTARRPRCDTCPLAADCRARAAGVPEAFPPRTAARPVERVRVAVALLRHRGRVLLERTNAESPLRGVLDLPAFEVAQGEAAGPAVESGMRRRHRLEVRCEASCAAFSHAIQSRSLRIEIHRCRRVRGRVDSPAGVSWQAPPRRGDGTPVSGATLKALRVLGDDR